MSEERVEKKWKDKKGNTLKLISIEGKWHKILKTKREDRLFFLQINEGEKFPITHLQQIEVMKNILMNDLIPRTFKSNCKKFSDAIVEIIKEWKERFENEK